MTHSTTQKSNRNGQPFGIRSAEFNARIEEGLRRAPEERAQAVKDFWNWIVARI